MPLTIAIAVGILFIAWGVALRVRNPEVARVRDVATTGNPAVDLSLQAAIPTSSGVGQVLVGLVVVATALATLVVS